MENGTRNVNTILSTRDYQVDGHWLVSLSLRDGASYTLEALRDALLEPVFPLYLGRKSCPLSVPVHPVISEMGSVKQALDTYRFPVATDGRAEAVLYAETVQYDWDQGLEIGLPAEETHERWDQPASRLRWQFDKRLVHSTRQQRIE